MISIDKIVEEAKCSDVIDDEWAMFMANEIEVTFGDRSQIESMLSKVGHEEMIESLIEVGEGSKEMNI